MVILQTGHPVLRAKSQPLTEREIASPKIQKLIKEMHKILSAAPDGVALAAPQIGKNVRIFVISEKAFASKTPETLKMNPRTYINPVIIRMSTKKEVFDEGCLSVRNVFGKIKRASKVTVEAYDETGRKFRRGASGLLAEIFQHEIDHLDGILFTDTATDLREVLPETKLHP